MMEKDALSTMEEGRPQVIGKTCTITSATPSQNHECHVNSHRAAAAKEEDERDLLRELDIYRQQFDLVYSMLLRESIRTASLKSEGSTQMNYPKSSDGWFSSLFILKGRALDSVFLPWCVVTLHAIVYTVIQEVVFESHKALVPSSWDLFFGLALSSTLAFLLVFRLNRGATRYWIARGLWGTIVAKGRTLVGGLVAHGSHDLFHRDEAIRWVAVFAICTMEHLRGIGISNYPVDNFAGILPKEQVHELQETKCGHLPLYAIDQVRKNLRLLFHTKDNTPASVAYSWTQHLNSLEQQLNTMMDSCGGMERIRGTPLPIVYVSHLRTFLMLSLLLFPYVWGPAWEWMTIPIVALAAFAWLGIDAASVEVESPFGKNRVNALDMDGFCLGLISTIQQQIQTQADAEISILNMTRHGEEPSKPE